MMETIQGNEPLLYIEQPTMEEPERKMQKHFQSGEIKEKAKKTGQRFNQLNLEEKILYILRVPPQLPALKCNVQTEHDSYRGIIKNATDDKLIIRLQNRKVVTIKKDMLKDIQLISF